MAKREDGSLNVTELMFTDFLARLYTFRRAVGVPRSVNTVSKLSVSVENDSMSDDDVVKSSSMHDVTIKPTKPNSVKSKKRICLI